MRRSLHLLIPALLLAATAARAQTTLVTESFETDGNNTRYTSNTYDDRGPAQNTRYFLRALQNPLLHPTTGSATFGTAATPSTITNVDGTVFWASENTRYDFAPFRAPGFVQLSALNVVGYNAIKIKVRLADARGAGYSNATQQWENTDYVRIQYQMDGGAVTTIGQFVGDNAAALTAGNLRRDTNLDGASSAAEGGTVITQALTEFTFNVPVTGSSLIAKIEVDQSGGTEELAFDKIEVIGTFVGVPNSAPVIANQTRSVAENSANGTNVGAVVTASDPDAGQTISYAITGGNAAGGFAINSSTGQITVANAAVLNFETTPSFALTVRVTDNAASPLNTSATVTVNLTNVNEAPGAVTDGNGATNTVAENASNGTAVGVTATATDPDGTTLS